MTRVHWTWLFLVGTWLAFTGWYTSFEGPLTEDEIATYLDRLADGTPPRSAEELAEMRRFMEEDTGDDFVMVNVIDLYETPPRPWRAWRPVRRASRCSGSTWRSCSPSCSPARVTRS